MVDTINPPFFSFFPTPISTSERCEKWIWSRSCYFPFSPFSYKEVNGVYACDPLPLQGWVLSDWERNKQAAFFQTSVYPSPLFFFFQ